MTITIADGRGALWQWDTGRRVKITDGDGVKQVHYQNRCFGRSVDVDVGDDGTAIIPDELLQDCHTLTAYAYVTDDTGAYTMVQQDFVVHKRAKPAGYVINFNAANGVADFEFTSSNGAAYFSIVLYDTLENVIVTTNEEII